jgi:HD domain-containing protein
VGLFFQRDLFSFPLRGWQADRSSRRSPAPQGSPRATIGNVEIAEWASIEAERLLTDDRVRWAHVQGVVELASEISPAVPASEALVLVAAAFLHDIGYSWHLRVTGAHQLDGARHLRRLGLGRLACLVAHHSEARFEIGVRGLAEELDAYAREESAVSDALTYCDMLTGASGARVSLEERLEEIEQRHGSGLVVDALNLARPVLERAVERTRARLAGHPQPM